MENGVLNYWTGKQSDNADTTLTMARETLNDILLGEAILAGKLAAGDVRIDGSQEQLMTLL